MSAPPSPSDDLPAVHLVSLGCARNDVDSEELAARLELGGFRLIDDAEDADAVLVNTCGFVESAKKDSVDTLLAAADLPADGRDRVVVAVGCLAERYGAELADAAARGRRGAGFDDYPDIAGRLRSLLAGERHRTAPARDRRRLLPLTPVGATRPRSSSTPGHGDPWADLPAGVAPASGPPLRRRLNGLPWAPLKLASGCDRRCSFCAIPAFRGAYLSRPPAEIVAEARWLAQSGRPRGAAGQRELLLLRQGPRRPPVAGEAAAPTWRPSRDWSGSGCRICSRRRCGPGLIEVMAGTPGVVPYFDLSFQHAAGPVLRRMRRFGDPDSFLRLLGPDPRARPRCAGSAAT